ncbi:hypothetical protein QTO34_001047 [Cnephaeus nilssonii]|uniref:MHC class I-like antigen recognition-like domain-containing protein n=1 Tax=Cnephaeus nilssonii TaxID=3371016 RepID=A0AA40HV54_CNENI|nr:hypothetical protein QTO34_001047 [Eptesicus nilssonii]
MGSTPIQMAEDAAQKLWECGLVQHSSLLVGCLSISSCSPVGFRELQSLQQMQRLAEGREDTADAMLMFFIPWEVAGRTRPRRRLAFHLRSFPVGTFSRAPPVPLCLSGKRPPRKRAGVERPRPGTPFPASALTPPPPASPEPPAACGSHAARPPFPHPAARLSGAERTDRCCSPWRGPRAPSSASSSCCSRCCLRVCGQRPAPVGAESQQHFSFPDSHSPHYDFNISYHEHPWCKVQGKMDEEKYLSYDCGINKDISMNLLREAGKAMDSCKHELGTLRDIGKELKTLLPDIKQEKYADGAPFTLQVRMTCQGKADEGTCGFLEFFLDGQRFLTFDNKTAEYRADNSVGERLKKKWENNEDLTKFFKMTLSGDCNLLHQCWVHRKKEPETASLFFFTSPGLFLEILQYHLKSTLEAFCIIFLTCTNHSPSPSHKHTYHSLSCTNHSPSPSHNHTSHSLSCTNQEHRPVGDLGHHSHCIYDFHHLIIVCIIRYIYRKRWQKMLLKSSWECGLVQHSSLLVGCLSTSSCSPVGFRELQSLQQMQRLAEGREDTADAMFMSFIP